MIKIAHVKETENLNLPKEVVEVIKSVTAILDAEYGKERNEQLEGGYIIILESKDDFEKLKEIYIDVDDIIPEYVDKITVAGGEDYTNSLILCNNDFGISVIIPMRLTPKILLENME
ncbi:MAG: hypothetical protein N4A48_05665 [Tepidibacter sp.]|jgi:fructose/tagatose bisphosphate aldolase|uniref:hypothetical protein n=1 Tax=Tepidibacter sp. TaxID=2529387 RepID=UPI0025F8C8C0|nr:hypothetical protein [Tepidibacter sp.]MCT4508241.1 hypothetical protein [Tepidibacter sp.]